ncbi:MAG: class I SAM-dependent rRNA methyltransferase, partial [Spirochaetales bacterium]|nr:class I SAM-dependent rRNA methyltransferase [Spirochaetales bacterium]
RNRYDVMILDPPKLAQTVKALENAKKAYKDLNRMAMEKIKDGGILVTCSCSGALSRDDFRTVLAWSAKDARVEVQVLETLGQAQDHPIRLSFPESEYLKVFILRVIK